jgi:putative transposase
MRSSRFSEEQIIAILREQEAGAATAEVCCKHGISSATFYTWKVKYGGLEVSETQRLRALGRENARLKKLLAEAKESFIGRLRDERLNQTLFTSLAHARALEARLQRHQAAQRARQPGARDRREAQRSCEAAGWDAAHIWGLRAPSRCTTEPARLK